MEDIATTSLTYTIKKALQNGLAFAVWSLPDTDIINHYFTKKENLVKIYTNEDLDQHKGFVFAPFKVCKHLPIYIFPENKNQDLNELENGNGANALLGNSSDFSSAIEIAEKNHIGQVASVIDQIKQGSIRKAVLSRNKWIDGYETSQMPELFNTLRETYPKAFVYQVYVPDMGYWVGATPELLLSKENGVAKTVSLAGTQPFNENLFWDHKETIEQELVTEHIRTVLKNFNTNDFRENGPFSIKAANLAHLKSTITFSTEKIKDNLGKFIDQLHPTPAVCGLPVKESLETIQQTEDYDREYYTGYLGPFNPNSEVNLFVNLRCLQAFDNGVVLYAGGGITNESNPQKEWQETKLKIKTLESILEKL